MNSQESITEEMTKFQDSMEELVKRHENHKFELEGKIAQITHID